jgi:fatty-acyl-CoA synthase
MSAVTSKTFVGVGEWLERRGALTPDKIGLVDADTGVRYSYRTLNTRARALAALLASEHGVRQGERVAALAANSPEYLDAYFACALLGAILVPLNWRLTVRELTTILGDCSPILLLHDETHRTKATEVAAAVQLTASRMPALQAPAGRMPALRASSAPSRSGRGWPWGRRETPTPAPNAVTTATASRREPRLLPFDAFPGADEACAARATPFQTADGEEPMLILYTSGTTGVPKGALLSHRMITWNAVNTQVSWGVWDTDIAPISSPFFHAGGLNVLTTPLYHLGGTVVLLRSNDPADILQAAAAERCTILFNVPTVFQAMMEHPAFATTDLSAVRFCVTGGSSCPLPVIEGFARRGLVFRQGYGLTEVGVNCFSLSPEDALRKAGSVGRPVFHSRARIVDEQDRDVPEGGVGELALAGPHVCSGYWNRPEATAEAFRGGWWHTGDLVQRDADGYYFIVGRKKDMYISGGENVYPAEIEQQLAQHPGIAEAAVIAQPDPKWGEVGVAVVVARAPGSLSAEEVLAYLDGKLARFKLPRRVEFAEVLPRNAMGKVLKAELVERYVTNKAPVTAER